MFVATDWVFFQAKTWVFFKTKSTVDRDVENDANGAQYTRGLHWYAIATQTLLIQ